MPFTHQPAHIKKIVLHSWTTGKATQLYRDVQPLIGPTYQSFVPPHNPLVVPDTAAATDDDPPAQS